MAAKSTKTNSPFVVIWRSIVAWWDGLINFAMLTLIWLACWFTIVLGPPATFGLYAAAAEMLDDYTTPSFRTMFDAAKKYFLRSWLWMGANLLVAVLFYVNLMFYQNIGKDWAIIVQAFIITIMVIWIGIQTYSLAFIYLQEKPSLWMAWRNGLLTAMASPPFTLAIWVISAILAVASVVLVLPIILGVPALVAVIGSYAVRNRLVSFGLRKPDPGLEPEEESETVEKGAPTLKEK